METSHDYYCDQCQQWYSEAEVTEYNAAYWQDDDDGPEVCPKCQYEVTWWSNLPQQG